MNKSLPQYGLQLCRRSLLCLLVLSFMPAAAQPAPPDQHPPIPIRFTLKNPGFVTLVIEDAAGKRIRNLVSETPFPAGENIAWWDGLDDVGRDPDAAAHAIYHIPGKLVAPGTYRARGLVRGNIDLRYQMTAYTSATIPWHTADAGSEWLSNHTPPSSVLFVPAGAAPTREGQPTSAGGQVLVGSYVSEGGSGLAWLDLTGRKLHGQGWVGGVWTGAQFLARDEGDHPVKGVYAYTGSTWKGDTYNGGQPELRLHELLAADLKRENSGAWVAGVWDPTARGNGASDTRMGTGEDRRLLSPNFTFPRTLNPDGSQQDTSMTGLAVHNGLLVVSLPSLKELLFVDAAAHRVLGSAPLEDPRGLAFDKDGRLLALSGKQLLRYPLATDPTQLATPEILVDSGLDDPQQLALDSTGSFYITDRGNSQQVKVFTAFGDTGPWKLVRVIGHPGLLKAGTYDPEHMSNPDGITVDSNNHIWVAETEFQPKRVSVWTVDGKLVNAFYGPPRYGGGGELDPIDTTAFYYDGMQFKLDWKAGTSWPVDVFYRPGPPDLQLPGGWSNGPQTPLYVHGRKYLTNAYNSNPTNGANIAALWIWKNGVAVPVAALGQANDWTFTPPVGSDGSKAAGGSKPRNFFDTPAFKGRLPAGASLSDRLVFAWSDLNGDGQVQPEEVTFLKGNGGGVTVMPDLSFVISRIDDRAMRFKPMGFTSGGTPRYDAAHGEILVTGSQGPTTSGGDQALVTKDGWTVLTVAPQPFAPQGPGGARNGTALWSYPSLWPGLHASHNAAMPDRPGELIGTTRLLGGTVTPRGSDAGPIWAVNGNKGNVYLFTEDGLFVATLFKDSRTASWDAPKAEKEMLVNNLSGQEEDFWPSITQTRDGKIYLQILNACILRVDGLESARRLPAVNLSLTPQTLQEAQAYFLESEAARQQSLTAEQTKITVALRPDAPIVDGKLDDWAAADWATIDVRTNQIGDWGHAEAKTQAALAVSGDHLYAAFKTGDANLLNNSGESLQNLFKSGGALDLALDAIPGGERLLVAQVKGKTTAVLYRPHVAGTTTEPVAFSSPLRTIRFDRVDDVSDQVTLAGDGKGSYELSVPLALLNLSPHTDQTIKGDIGLLRGNGFQTWQRVYWHNKATGLVSDIPSEAELTPQLWGDLEFKATP